jgi:hypothetical protein
MRRRRSPCQRRCSMARRGDCRRRVGRIRTCQVKHHPAASQGATAWATRANHWSTSGVRIDEILLPGLVRRRRNFFKPSESSRSPKPDATMSADEDSGMATGSREISRLLPVFRPSSPLNSPAIAVVLNISGVNVGLRSLRQVMVVAAVTVPLTLNAPEIAKADDIVNEPDRITPRNNNPILLISYIVPNPLLNASWTGALA